MGVDKKKGYNLDPSQLKWSEQSVPASEFIEGDITLPCVVKLDSGGTYNGAFGSGTEVDVNQPFLLYTARDGSKVIAENVIWDKNREKYVDTGEKIIIPTNYPGYFSTTTGSTSERIKPWHIIGDIPLKSTHAILATQQVRSFKLSERTTSGEKVYMKKNYPEGEIFELGELFVERTTSTAPTCCITWMFGGKSTKETTDEVEFVLSKDSNNTDLLLPVTAKGCFYKTLHPRHKLSDGDLLDKETVYNICDIINSINLPGYLHLIHGKAPINMQQQFSGALKVMDVYSESTILACSLGSSKFNLLEFPLDSDIHFIPATNSQEVINQYCMQDALEYCLNHVMPYIVSLKVIQNLFSENDQQSGGNNSDSIPEVDISVGDNKGFIPDGLNNGDTQSYFSDDFTEDGNTICSGESHYETIPYDKSRKTATRDIPKVQSEIEHNNNDIAPVHGLSKVLNTNTDDDEYLVPAHIRNQPLYSNVENRHGNIEIKRSVSSTSDYPNIKNGIVCPANSISGEFEVRNRRSSFSLKRLPSMGKERMDRFLQDSLEELNRFHSPDYCDNIEDIHVGFGDLKLDYTTKVSEQETENVQDDANNMKATLDAFLEEIFDCKNLENGKVNIENIVNRQVSADGADKTTDSDIDITKSISEEIMFEKTSIQDTPIENGQATSEELLYRDDSPTSTVDNRGCDNENSSSSYSRSASSIYNQMNHIAKYGKAESCHQGHGPYTRTDSGIFVSPRYSMSESGYNRGIYQAMSDVSWTPPEDLTTLTVEDVSLSMIYIGIKQRFVDLFFDQQIDGQQLLEMDDNLLKEGFPDMNSLERKKVLDFIKGWRPKKLV